MRIRRSGDLYFVFASALACLFLFFSVIMPKVQANRVTRSRLEAVVGNTKEILGNVQTVGKRAQALQAGDPFFLMASLRWYLERHGEPWPEAQQGESAAGDPDPGGS